MSIEDSGQEGLFGTANGAFLREANTSRIGAQPTNEITPASDAIVGAAQGTEAPSCDRDVEKLSHQLERDLHCSDHFCTNASPTPGPKNPPLDSFDVFAFIVNKMVGTGIILSPAFVLRYTNNKAEAIIFWCLGLLYTQASAYVYLRLSKAWFFNGGELIFIDELYRYLRRNTIFLKVTPNIGDSSIGNTSPGLLFFVIYGFYFLVIWTTGTTALQFGHQILVISNPDIGRNIDHASLNLTLQTFLGIIALTLFCLLNFFSEHVSRKLNRWLAYFKIALLLTLLIGGIVTAARDGISLETDFKEIKLSSTSALAFLSVVFAYQGWENAVFVLSEAKNYRALKSGFMWGTWLVGLLYCFINMLFVLLYKSGTHEYKSTTAIFGLKDTTIRIWAVLTAISGAGSMIAVIYTSARVKLVFANSNMIPWSKIWTQESRKRQTPVGGILLHWISSFIFIIIGSIAYRKNRIDQLLFSGDLLIYGHSLISVPLILLFFLLPRIIKNTEYYYERRLNNTNYIKADRYTNSKNRIWRISELITAVICLAFNCYIVGFSVKPNEERLLQGWHLLAINSGVIIFAVLYYRTIWLIWRNNNPFCGVTARFCEPEPTENDRRFGRRVRLEFQTVNTESKTAQFFYWFFSGEKHPNADRSPKDNFRLWRESKWESVSPRKMIEAISKRMK